MRHYNTFVKMLLGKSEVLTFAQLKRLSDHKYNCTSVSVLDGVMQVYWSWLVEKLPLWLAPNLITIAGLIVNIITSLILVFYSPNAREDVPRWAFLLCALGLFVYQSLDAIDGKQARRTATSSPLGELFDHGCDSISTVFVSVSACIAVQLGTNPDWMFVQCMTAVTLFYSAHWQTYVSGTLRFGRFDVTEAQFGVITLHIISGIFGASIWSSTIPALNVELKYIPAVIIFIGSSMSFIRNFNVIFTGGAGKNGSTVAIPILHVELKVIPFGSALIAATAFFYANINVILMGGVGKNGSTVADTSVLSPCIPFSLVIVPAFIIYQKSITHLYENHPCLYIITFGLVAAKVTNRLVVAHMTKSEMDYLDSVLVGPGMLFLNQYFNTTLNEYVILWLCLAWIIFNLLHYCTVVCSQICQHLKIRLFVIHRGGTMTILEQKHLIKVKRNTSLLPSDDSHLDVNGEEEDNLHSFQDDLDIRDASPDRQPLLPTFFSDERKDLQFGDRV